MRPVDVLAVVILTVLALWLLVKVAQFLWGLYNLLRFWLLWRKMTPEEKARFRAGQLLQGMAESIRRNGRVR